ncbi:ABC transporter ATP-binding protein [Mycetocola zhadangensis]|uniref:ATP-binding cassette domain-containing protein n=1 Tax=Mycetocola zhadangensis TaxID=1164595 RepID=A0A3L7J281_9MICO|nr:ATP-binding cassette domain-containing protein [Mycetocola zhadangensis]RLQ84676.1 ATP-binding cassette domain-containing protein [Mycetocola zhadangensis]
MIDIQQLSKHYGDVIAVDDISLYIPAGTITGFLGPNGAGKSTLLRLVCGLTRPTTGSALIGGLPYSAIGNPGRTVGVSLDASALHSGRTGRESLALAALLMGVGTDRVDTVLETVGLSRGESRRRVGSYSLGMRQRLGLAHAVLGDPRVLILDEPANGLDPHGIHWLRSFLRSYADGGGTVLLSSHLLAEVDALADYLAILGRGRLLAHGPRDSLVQDSAPDLESYFLNLTGDFSR